MNHRVPDFEMGDDHSIPATSGLARPKKSSFMAEDEIMELLWQNGQVIAQSQNQRKSSPEFEIRHDHDHDGQQQQQQQQQQQHLFMQEDEMASWLHYPLADDDFSADLLYPAPAVTATTATVSAPPPGPSCSKSAGGGVATVVDSCDTPALGGRLAGESSYGGGLLAVSAKEASTAAAAEASSPGDSSASSEPPSPQPAKFPPEDRKRKGVEPPDEADCHSEDAEFESGDAKKQARGTSSAKRTRAAEVHNLSERVPTLPEIRRRDRINEKMKALQELIPRCNKSDKASMLDEAIEYLKSLQLQVQMMSMGCGMVPMMFPGIQQYMPPMGMGIGMGMGMGMEMGMNRPMMPFPNMLAGSAMTGPAAAAHMGPRFPIPAFHMPSVPHTAETARAQPTNQPEHMFQPFVTQNPNQSRMPNLADPYQQYLGSHQMQLPVLPQHPPNHATVQPSTSKPSTSRGPENPENHQSG